MMLFEEEGAVGSSRGSWGGDGRSEPISSSSNTTVVGNVLR